MLPYFLRHEDHHGGSGELHAAGGEWRVERPRISWEILDAVRDAAAEVGIPKIDDFNRGDNEGSDYFEVNQRRGLRVSAAKAFLKPVLKRKNLRLVTGAHARRLTMEGRRVAGLEYSRSGERRRRRARREIVLTAGAIGTPHLLELSGIGRPEALARIGQPVLHALPGVGENLQDHLQLRTIFKIGGARTLNQDFQSRYQAGADGSRLRLQTARAADHGAVATRHVREVLARLRHRQPRVSRSAALARPLWRAAAQISPRSRSASAICGRRAAATCMRRAPMRAPRR